MPDSNFDDDHKPFAATMKASAQGTAALLLVESLIHGLIGRSILTVQEAIDIVEIAAEIEREQAIAAADLDNRSPPASLASIAASLRFDLDR